MENRPVGRKKNVTEGGSGVHKRGEGIGTGPVGNSSGYSSGSGPSENGGGMKRSGRGVNPLFMIIVLLFLAGGGGLSTMLGGGQTDTPPATQTPANTAQNSQTSQGGNSGAAGSILGQLFGGYGSYTGSGANSATWSDTPNTGNLNTSVDSRAREKRTVIKGNGQDNITIMVYMCGADLESRNGMASRDIQEMMKADIGDKINLLVYTGGCKQWQNNVISNATNQIYQIKDGKLNPLVNNVGNLPMTKAETLSDYIKWSAKNFPAD